MCLVPLVMLAGCDEAPAKPEQDTAADACKAASLQVLVGQPKSVVENMDLPEATRILGPNQPVTMDFRPDRLNIEIGTDGRIKRIGCY